MRVRIINLLGRLKSISPQTVKAAGILAGLTKVNLPPPQVTWTLIGLLHYRQRKLWAWQVVRDRLQPQAEAQGGGGLVSVTDVLDQREVGVVPGLPDWEFDFDGNWSFLRHRGTRESIHIDVLNGPEVISQGAFLDHVETHQDPGSAVSRLRELFPHTESLLPALQIVRRRGLTHKVSESEFELHNELTACTEQAEAFLAAWADGDTPARMRLASWIGDWPAAHELASSSSHVELMAVTGPQAERCRKRWLRHLRQRVRRAGLSGELLLALVDAPADDLPRYIQRALSDNDGAVREALELVAEHPAWAVSVYQTFLDILAKRQYSAYAERCALYLSRHGYKVGEVLERLLNGEGQYLDVAIIVALKWAPNLLPQALRRALRSHYREHRLTGAAVLALLDTDWSRRELCDCLHSAVDQDMAVECLAALGESQDPEARRRAARWEEDHLSRGEVPPNSARFWYEYEGGCVRVLRDKMAELFDRVYRVRSLLPEAPGAG